MGTHRIVLLKKWLQLRGVIDLGVLGILPLLYHLLTVTLQGKKDVVICRVFNSVLSYMKRYKFLWLKLRNVLDDKCIEHMPY